jgi:hypothetical protein
MSLIQQLDDLLGDLFKGWNTTSSVLLVLITTVVAWIILEAQDADTHPLILARQAQASLVRQPGESATFRSPEVQHGCQSPLCTAIIYIFS